MKPANAAKKKKSYLFLNYRYNKYCFYGLFIGLYQYRIRVLMYDKNTDNVIRIVLSVTGPRSSGLSVHVKDNPLCRVITISVRSYFTGRFSQSVVGRSFPSSFNCNC